MRAKVVYALVAVFVTSIALAVANVAYTNYVDQRRADSARTGVEAQRRAAEQTKAGVCALVDANVQVYQETPPQTAAGKNLAAAWETLKVQFGC